MKRIITLAAILAIAGACAKESNEDPAEIQTESGNVQPMEEIVSFNASVSESSRIISYIDGNVLKTHWSAGDRIGLFAVSSGDILAKNLGYEAVAEAATSDFNPVSDAVKWKDASSVHDFSAYYPFSGTVDDSSVVPYVIPSSQTQSAAGDASHIAAIDLLYANASCTKAGSVGLHFNHLFSVLEIDLTSQLPGLEVSRIVASFADGEIAGQGTFNISDGSMTRPSGGSSITLDVATPSELSSVATKYYLVISPGHGGQNLTVTVTAMGHDYTFIKTPSKDIASGQKSVLELEIKPARCASGVRASSKTLLWSTLLSGVDGIKDASKVNGIAPSGDYVLLSEVGNSNPVYLDALTGQKAGTMDVSVMTSAENDEYYATSDDGGNILFCSRWQRPSETHKFKVYKAASVSESPVATEMTRDATSTRAMGWKISVSGNIDSNAIVSMPYYDNNAYKKTYLLCWQYSDGNLVTGSWLPNLGTSGSSTINYPRWADGIYSGAGKDSDVFFTCYELYDGNRYATWFDCTDASGNGTFTVKHRNPAPTYLPMCAVDYIVFNNAGYFLYNIVSNNGSQANANNVFMYDTSVGDLSSRVELCDANEFSKEKNASGYGDVIARVSPDGYYLYVYLVFADGYAACYRFDCFAES